jgi:hypothetical protein
MPFTVPPAVKGAENHASTSLDTLRFPTPSAGNWVSTEAGTVNVPCPAVAVQTNSVWIEKSKSADNPIICELSGTLRTSA